MHVLLVEDEEAAIRQIRSRLETSCGAVVEVARSRDAAVHILHGDHDFDLIICDLKIPTIDSSLDAAVDHGLLVYDVASTNHPGTFCVFFSGYANLDNVGSRLARGPSVDVFGTGEQVAIVDVLPKSKQPEFLALATMLNTRLAELNEIQIVDVDLALTSEFKTRTLQIYARQLSGTRVIASKLGGLSGATVLRVEILDDSEASVGHVVGKVDLLPNIEDELARYHQYVAPVLRVGSFAPLAREIRHGCGRFGAAFYTLVANGYSDLFELADRDGSSCIRAVERLRDSHQEWRGEIGTERLPVGSIREAWISDEEFAPWIDSLGRARVAEVGGSDGHPQEVNSTWRSSWVQCVGESSWRSLDYRLRKSWPTSCRPGSLGTRIELRISCGPSVS